MILSCHDDNFFMNYALRLAARNIGLTGKNPSVACVLVSNSKILSYGVTGRGGSPHAEFVALNKIKRLPPNTIAYITLEPCSHVGNNPSCTAMLIKRQISKVVIATNDPNPLVNGSGIKILKDNGVVVEEGVNEPIANNISLGFTQTIKGLNPEVNVKVASYLNGDTVPVDKKRWITNSLSRSYGHMLRSNHDAIVVGVNTVKIDNPSLDCRLPGLMDRSPAKVVIDSSLTTPMNSALVKNAYQTGLIIISKLKNNKDKVLQYESEGVEVICVDAMENGFVNLNSALKVLRIKGFNRILIEGGSMLSSSFLDEGLVNLVYWFNSNEESGNNKLLSYGDRYLQKFKKESKLKIKDSINLKNNKLEIFKVI